VWRRRARPEFASLVRCATQQERNVTTKLLGLSLCLGLAGGLWAQPLLSVKISATLGPQLGGGTGGVTSGSYTSGITAQGSAGQTCVLSITGAGGSGAKATVTLSATNKISAGTILTITAIGRGYSFTTPPSTATVAAGTANSCAGTATIATHVDDPLDLNGLAVTVTTNLNPVGVSYNASSIVYNNVTLTLTYGPLQLTCSGSTATITLNDPTDGENDTLTLAHCTISSLVQAALIVKAAFAPGTIPAPLPLAFTAPLISSPDTASQATYTIQSGVDAGDATVLGMRGTIATLCPSSGVNACPTETLTPPGPLSFNAQSGGTTPPAQSVTVSTGGTPEPYAVTTSTTSGGNWLTVNNASATGGTSGGSFAVDVNPTGLAAGTYTGTVGVYAPASNSPRTLPVTFTVGSPGNLIAAPSALIFESSPGTQPPTQALAVTLSTGASIAYTAAVSTSDGNPWLAVSPAGGTTGGAGLTVAADVTQVPRAGTYHGTITLTAAGVASLAVPVTFRVIGTLYSFAGGHDGAGPAAPVVIGSQNVLYGTTAAGGASDDGIVFSLTPPASSGGDWNEQAIYTFKGTDGAKPRSPLAMNANGIVFYGTTEDGGASGFGEVFSLYQNGAGVWIEEVLYSFTGGADGSHPQGQIVLAKDVLYGVTTYGGKYGRGTAFSLTAPGSSGTWTAAVLHNFGGTGDGVNPYSGLITAKGGVLYGTTYTGGAANAGTVFSLTPPGTSGGAWVENVLYSFTGAADGGNPYGGVTVGGVGLLYGMTSAGGSQSGGVVYSLTAPVTGSQWTEAVLCNFNSSTGESPHGGLALKSGALYGTTSKGGRSSGDLGTVFKLLPPSSSGGAWQLSVLHSFAGSDGANPLTGLALSPDGVFYGTTNSGGNSNFGTIFLVTQ
jgi:uncharacterized repeat protein (TIGR03803 family)